MRNHSRLDLFRILSLSFRLVLESRSGESRFLASIFL